VSHILWLLGVPRNVPNSEFQPACAPEATATKMRHERLEVAGGSRVVLAIADPDLLVCCASFREILANATDRGFTVGC
jgi:hypothetical protein